MSKRKIALTAILVVSLIGVLGAISGRPASLWLRVNSIIYPAIGTAGDRFVIGGSGLSSEFVIDPTADTIIALNATGSNTKDIRGTSSTWYVQKDGVIKILSTNTCPGTCVVGSLCHDDNAGAAAQLLVCETTNNWVAQGTGAGGDDILIDASAVVNPNFDPGGDIIFVDTANTVTANIQTSKVTNTMMADDAIGKAEMKDEDFGDWTCLTSSCTLDVDVIAKEEMADDDFGDFTCAGGICTLDANSVLLNEIGPDAVGNSEMADDAIGAAEMADEDHGAVSWSGGVATVEDLVCTGCVDITDLATDSVNVQEIASNAVRNDEIQAGAVKAAEISDSVCLYVFNSTSTNPTEANGTPDFLSLLDRGGSQTENNEDDYIVFAAQTMTINNLRCVTATAPGAGNDKWVMTVRVGTPGTLSDKTVTCEIDETNVDCTNTSNFDAVDPGEAVTIGIESVGGVSPPTDSALITCAVCLGVGT